MDLLRLEHKDFVCVVNCARPEVNFRKALQRQPGLLTATGYRLDEAAGFVLLPGMQQTVPISANGVHPVFFENKQYTFWIEFYEPKIIDSADVKNPRLDVEEAFTWHKKSGVLTGSLNFGNDIGKASLTIVYRKQQQIHTCVFHFEVFPVKLDYTKHYRDLVLAIEKLYPNLIYDFLKKTYTQFRPGTTEHTDLIWWRLFGGLYEDFFQSATYILQHPRRKLQKEKHMLPADRLTELTPELEEELAEYRKVPGHLYRSPAHHYTLDIAENRFVKYALQQTHARFLRLSKLIRTKYANDISDSFKKELEGKQKHLHSLVSHPVLRNFGEYKGIKQESLVLQQATGYSTLYRCWLVLRTGAELFDGFQKLELKSIDSLYQIWCFLEMSQMITSILGIEPETAELAKFRNDNFIVGFETGKYSKLVWNTSGGEKIVLFHDFQFGRKSNTQIRSYTVPQRPDIVLHIEKNDLRERYTLSYLFDAKYRIQMDESAAVSDAPPDDAINQMHRYRDAIFHSEGKHKLPGKEIIGAYVLFPGSNPVETVRNSYWHRSINDVNIGAFQLLPGSAESSILLREHLQQILSAGSEQTLEKLIPHKGIDYEPVNPEVLVGVIKRNEQTAYFESESEPIYHTGPLKEDAAEEWLRITARLRYFSPRYVNKGIKTYYEIAHIQLLRRCEIFPSGHVLHNAYDRSLRIVFQLCGKKYIRPDEAFLSCQSKTYGYTNLAAIRSFQEGEIQLKWEY
jgi:Domain of unknown function (DUF2357)/PD-(D/E)XK nuclease superfamily